MITDYYVNLVTEPTPLYKLTWANNLVRIVLEYTQDETIVLDNNPVSDIM